MSIYTIFIDKFSKKSHIFLNYGIKKNGNQYFIAKGNAEIISLDEIKLRGAHNILNIMAALALCEPFMILFATQGSYGLISYPSDVRSATNF